MMESRVTPWHKCLKLFTLFCTLVPQSEYPYLGVGENEDQKYKNLPHPDETGKGRLQTRG